MLRTTIAAAATVVAVTGAVGASAHAAELKRQGTPQAIIARAVVVPAGSTTVYVSGITPQASAPAVAGATPVYGDTKTQTISILTQISEILKAEGFGMADMAMLRVYLAADPAKGGKMDFAGMNEAYSQFFGAATNGAKPARLTVQVAQLVNPAYLVEIEGQAVKAP